MKRARVPRALTIAGSDSAAGAGIQADLKTFAAFGVYGTSAIAALTVQDTRGVHRVRGVDPGFLRAQIEAVLADIGAGAVKTGMLLDAATVRTVARTLAAHGVRRLVVDPVLAASGGERLLARRALGVLRTELVPLAAVVTPNLAEATALVGFPVEDVPSMEAAAGALVDLGARAAVVTGGHLAGDPVDVLATRTRVRSFRGRRIPVAAHGTGCTFSAAIAAALARGAELEAAVRMAKRYTAACLRRALRIGHGRAVLGHLPRRS